MSHRTLLCFALFLGFVSSAAQAQPPSPKPPKEYAVTLRYRIYTGRNDRIKQYFAMTKYLESIGFRKDVDDDTEPEDTSHVRMSGVIPSASSGKILEEPHVKSVQLVPVGYKIPEEGVVKVQLQLIAGLPIASQRLLTEQVRLKLLELGFREQIGYDHRGFTRMLGTLPVLELDTLLKDLRYQPSGWLLPDNSVALLPTPLRLVSPILITEVIPEPEGFPPMREAPMEAAPPVEGKEFLRKISPDLRDLATKEAMGAPRRLEVILTNTPAIDDLSWRRMLSFVSVELVIEGRLGPLVTVFAPARLAPALAELPIVSTVRLPRAAAPQVQRPRGSKDGNLAALHASGLIRLHSLGHRGKGIRVAVIDGDFRGYEQYVGKGLPKTTQYLDFTSERNPDLNPDDFPSAEGTLGHGTECALAVALAAPKADLLLIRIDPACPYQLQAVARYLNGEPFHSESYLQRFEEIERTKDRLRIARENILRERRLALDNFGQDEKALAKRDAYFKNQAALDAEEKAFEGLLERFLRLQKDLNSLKNVQIVSSSLVWNDGYPLGGASPLSHYLEDRSFRSALWYQSAGNTRGQTWSGMFRDSDGNGVMEFALPGETLRPERWTSELNFLAWHPYGGKKPTPELPAKAKLRLSIQWREIHDRELFRNEEDVYREPIAKLRLLILRQRDFKGQALAADDLELVARSDGLPQRLENHPTYAVYEQFVEFSADPEGRYALRVEGQAPTDIRPSSSPSLSSTKKAGELRPRIFVNMMDDASRKLGRAVFMDYPTDLGALGVPADARGVITVGVADKVGQPTSYSTTGPALNLEMLLKPEVLGYDNLYLGKGASNEAFGASQAASFAAGLTATSFSAGTDRIYFQKFLRERTGKALLSP